jgi:kanamycin kinase
VTEWNPETIGQSTARVWRGAGVHRKEGDPATIAAEAERLAWLNMTGIPCPEIVEHTPGRLVMTTVPGRSAAAGEWPVEMVPRLIDGLTDVLRALQALPIADCPYDRRLAVTMAEAAANAATGLVDLDDLDGERRGWTIDRLLAELRATRPSTEDLVVAHGDLSMPNVLFDDDGRVTGLVDLGRLGVADRHQDLALAGRSLHVNWGEGYAERLYARFDDVDPARLAFYRLLDEFA